MKDMENVIEFNPNRKVTFAIDRKRLKEAARGDDRAQAGLLDCLVDALMGDKEADEFVHGLASHGIAVVEKTH